MPTSPFVLRPPAPPVPEPTPRTHPPAHAVDVFVVDEAGSALALRRSFSSPSAPGAWTMSLHGHRHDQEDAACAARRTALRVLGLTLHRIVTVVPGVVLRSPCCPTSGPPGTGTVLLAVAPRRVVTPDPRRFDDASWVDPDDREGPRSQPSERDS